MILSRRRIAALFAATQLALERRPEPQPQTSAGARAQRQLEKLASKDPIAALLKKGGITA